ncbi:MAG: hypothetical protein RRC07_06235 [Anaerolineae bacterium]|nr:hypothetical protein [Anaerolineae bacterium]
MNASQTTRTLIFFLLLLGLAACNQAALPTPVPTAAIPDSALPTPEPTPGQTSGLPATRDLATATALPPTATSSLPTSTPTATATPVIAPILSIGSPAAGARLPLGGEVEVSGFSHSLPGMILQLGLISETGWTITSATAELDAGGWRGTVAIPPTVYGSAELQAVLLDAGGGLLASDSIPVFVELAEPRPESYLTLIRPPAGMIAAAGHAFYADGNLRSETGGSMRFSVLVDDCQEEIAHYAFTLRGSTYWQAYVILPEEAEGSACAVVTKDQPGSEEWLAAQVPITIFPRGDERGVSVAIANPAADQRITGGQTITINGVAYNAPEGQVHLTAMLANGRMLVDTTLPVDRFGYWEFELSLPPDVDGQAQIHATLGDILSPVASTQLLFNVVPSN